MRRSLLCSSLITVLGLAIMGASTCGTTGPAAKTFAAGALVIPMDNCYQRRDASTPSQTVGCTAPGGADDGVFRAYGLVYFLLKHGVTVYWGIDAASPKVIATAPDVAVPAPAAGAVVQKLNWGSGAFADFGFPATTGITYLGGPFIIDAADAERARSMMTDTNDAAHADFARFQSEGIVDIHEVQVAFDAKQVRPLTTTPPKIAILNVTPPPGKKTASNVMYQYAVAAGLSWPCAGTGDCAGGLGSGCNKQAVLDYLASPGGDTAIPQVCNGPLCAPNFNTGSGSGLIYDLLCDGDFIPPGAGTGYADTQLAKGNYKLLWIPHWDTNGTTPTGSADAALVPALPAAAAADKLAWQLRTISSFVQAGNNVFAECLGIQALEGVTGQDNVNGSPVGVPATRFQTPAGIQKWNGSGTLQPILEAAHPDMQVGDFAFSVVTGAITTYFPRANQTPAAAYLSSIKRLITEVPSGTTPPNWDVSSTIQVLGNDSSPKGSVAYLGGHDYSPRVGNAPGATGQTAGTRIVLNTLFNLGFACADPNTACTTGLLGACAQGVLKCAGGGGLQCVGPKPGAPLCDGSDADADCDGNLDKYQVACQPSAACAEGSTQACYEGPVGTAGVGVCKSGQQTCTGGLWGPCQKQVLPQHEVCNGLDDDCNGKVDDGNLCGPNATCTAGICLPGSCNSETARCPNGFTCNSVVSGTCQPDPCPSSPCPAGKVCQAGACADPCAGVTCGPGSSCSGGQCVAGGCSITPCSDPTKPVCLAGDCVADPCAGNTCPTGTFCRLGDCVRSCAYVSCASGQHCDADGFCQPDCSPACGAGQACVAGACLADPCTGVQCAPSQACQGGVCLDAGCSHVTCLVGNCVAGQCVGGPPASVVTPITPAPTPSKGGGCGTGGAGDLASLFLAAGVLWVRRRRLAPLVAAVRPGAALALSCALALGLSACSKSGGGDGTVSCPTAQTACGADCADLAASTLHCGACGHGCAAGFACTVGACVFPTGNPFVQSVTPDAFGLGASPPLQLAGVGFQAGATVRVTGLGATQELPLTVNGATSASLAAGAIDLTGAGVGAGQLRVLNPGRLVSNAVAVSVVDALAVRTVTPAFVRQDGTAAVDLTLTGLGFVQGAVVTLTVNGAAQALPTSFTGAGELHATLPAPSTLPIGHHALLVTNPGGAASTPAAFSVSEGTPVVSAIDPTCAVASPSFAGSVTGTFLYPTSVVHVSGGTVADSFVATACIAGTDALGRCAGGELRVTSDLTPVTPGVYAVTVWNPGSPSPLKSVSGFNINVKGVGSSCP